MSKCKVSDCTRLAHARGLCQGHITRQRKGRLLEGPFRNTVRQAPVCSVDGCHRATSAKSLCSNHYNQKRRRSDDNFKKEQASRLKRDLQISPEMRLALISKASSKCEICSTELIDNRANKLSSKYPHIDHDHVTGNIRGVLCCNCNRGLGMFKDNTDLILKAINYLNKEHYVPDLKKEA